MFGVLELSYSHSSLEVSKICHEFKAKNAYLLSDTPWDEPTKRSPEFCRFLSGQIFRESPWKNLSQDALC